VTRVDFYILQDVDLDAARRFACRLAVKALAGGHSVHVHVDDATAAAELDELLWEYPEHRFVPHDVQGTGAGLHAPVVVGWDVPGDADGVLVNLSSEVPTFFGRFPRVAEIVVDANRAVGRDRYKFYRDRGYPLFHHELDDWEAA
jgi:DNA polymerase-3 subunit chi